MGRAKRMVLSVLVALVSVIALGGCEAPDVRGTSAKEVRASLSITEDFRDGLMHGEKGGSYQRYVVLHDSEGDGSAAELVDFWAASGNGAASHFVVNRDGTIVQCVPLDAIAHHAGFGDEGHNDAFGVREDGRDDLVGTVPLGPEFPDYGMNSYSVGITMVHRGEPGEAYPEAQLAAVDGLITYIDAYYGSQSQIIEHRDWRTGCEGCSEEFAPYLAALKQTRRHDGTVAEKGDADDDGSAEKGDADDDGSADASDIENADVTDVKGDAQASSEAEEAGATEDAGEASDGS